MLGIGLVGRRGRGSRGGRGEYAVLNWLVTTGRGEIWNMSAMVGMVGTNGKP